MNKSDYKTKNRELLEQMAKIDEQIDQLREQYIEENKPCEIDDIVEVESRNGNREKGVVVDFNIGPSDDVQPLLRKVKKDGSASSHRLRVWYDQKIIYPEKQNA